MSTNEEDRPTDRAGANDPSSRPDDREKGGEKKESVKGDKPPVEEEKVPTEPELTEEQKKELEERTKAQEAADKRNRERDRKCNCSKENTKTCCKRFASAMAFALLVNLCTAAYFTVMYLILMEFLKDGDKFLIQDIITMNGPGAAAVAPSLSCTVNQTKYHCDLFTLGGVAPKCPCSQEIYAQDLWLQLRKQRDMADSFKPSSFNQSTNEYDTAKANIYGMIDKCTGGVDLDDVTAYLRAISQNQMCFLIGLNNIVNWVPEPELIFETHDVQTAIQMLNRTYPENIKGVTIDWVQQVKTLLHSGHKSEDAIKESNALFGLGESEQPNPEAAGGVKCKEFLNGTKVCIPVVADRATYFGTNVSKSQYFGNSTDPDVVGKYVPVICEANYPGIASRVALEVYPQNGIYIPSFNIFTGDEFHTPSVVAIVLPKKLYAAVASVECAFLARNIDYRTTASGNLEFLFSYMA